MSERKTANVYIERCGCAKYIFSEPNLQELVDALNAYSKKYGVPLNQIEIDMKIYQMKLVYMKLTRR